MKWKPFMFGIAVLFSSMAMAGDMGTRDMEDITPSTCGKVVTFSFGPAWYNDIGEVEKNFIPSLTSPPGSYHTYIPRRISGVLGSLELFFGLTRSLSPKFSGQLGLAAGYNSKAVQRGYLYTGVSPNIAINSYSYKVSNSHASIKGKLVTEWAYWVKPYVSVSGGAGFNNSWGYVTTHSILGIPSRPFFNNATSVGFTFTGGIGLQGDIAPNWQVGIGYEFADWGKNALGSPKSLLSNDQILGVFIPYRGLHSGNFYTHELQFSVSYII